MKIHTLEGYIQNIYLVEYEDKLMLLDGACRADVITIKRFITNELKRDFSELKVVMVTHMHPDHAGAAMKLRQLTGCQVITGSARGHWYEGFIGLLMYASDLLLALWVANRMKKKKANIIYPRKLVADMLLGDQSLVPGFEDWKVVATPGHTDRDISLFHEQTNTIYVADLLVKVKSQLISPFPIFHPNQYRTSVSKVYDMRPTTLLIAHGGEVEFDEQSYKHVIETTPITPSTHWRSIKAKFYSVLRQLTPSFASMGKD